MLLASLGWLAVAVALAFVGVRYMGYALALGLVALAVLRVAPAPYGSMWSNRSVIADVATLLGLAAVVTILVLTVPGV